MSAARHAVWVLVLGNHDHSNATALWRQILQDAPCDVSVVLSPALFPLAHGAVLFPAPPTQDRNLGTGPFAHDRGSQGHAAAVPASVRRSAKVFDKFTTTTACHRYMVVDFRARPIQFWGIHIPWWLDRETRMWRLGPKCREPTRCLNLGLPNLAEVGVALLAQACEQFAYANVTVVQIFHQNDPVPHNL